MCILASSWELGGFVSVQKVTFTVHGVVVLQVSHSPSRFGSLIVSEFGDCIHPSIQPNQNTGARESYSAISF